MEGRGGGGEVDGRDRDDVVGDKPRRRRADPPPEVGEDRPLDAPDVDARASRRGGGRRVARPASIVVAPPVGGGRRHGRRRGRRLSPRHERALELDVSAGDDSGATAFAAAVGEGLVG